MSMLRTLGVVIEKGDKLALYSLQSDSDIYTTIDNQFYLGLAKPSSIGIGATKEKFHVVRSNVPFEPDTARKHSSISPEISRSAASEGIQSYGAHVSTNHPRSKSSMTPKHICTPSPDTVI